MSASSSGGPIVYRSRALSDGMITRHDQNGRQASWSKATSRASAIANSFAAVEARVAEMRQGPRLAVLHSLKATERDGDDNRTFLILLKA
jgi:hypothetical protein